MNSKYDLTKKELSMMEILWKADQPLAATDFPEYDTAITIPTTQAYLKKLLDKELIIVHDIVLKKKSWARRYRPALTKDEFESEKYIEALGKKRINITTLISSFFDDNMDDTKALEELAKLNRIIQQKQEEIKNKKK